MTGANSIQRCRRRGTWFRVPSSRSSTTRTTTSTGARRARCATGRLTSRVDVQFRNRFSAEVGLTEQFIRFEKDFRNRQIELGVGYNTREYNSVRAGRRVRPELRCRLPALVGWRQPEADAAAVGGVLAGAAVAVSGSGAGEHVDRRVPGEPVLHQGPLSEGLLPDQHGHCTPQPPGGVRLAVPAAVRHGSGGLPARHGAVRRALRQGNTLFLKASAVF